MMINFHFIHFIFSHFSPLAEGFGYFWHQIQILREKSSLGTNSEVWGPKSSVSFGQKSQLCGTAHCRLWGS